MLQRTLVYEGLHIVTATNGEEALSMVDACKPDLSILGDRDALKQILLILLENALKYSRDSVRVSAEALESMVHMRVHDQGGGIDPKTLEHIFERFYRGDENASIPGFGLGLPIAQSLVNAQGGSIQVESSLGSGTTVTVSLPRAG